MKAQFLPLFNVHTERGLSKAIMLSFSFRQGDPLAMLLYIIYIEPLLILIEKKTSGLILPNLKNVEAFCDYLNVITTKETDLLVVDEAVQKFEKVSGAILSRNRKCQIIGFGKWKDREVWPLQYIKAVKEIKVFGVIFMNSYRDMLSKNWSVRFQKFEAAIISWNGRILESIYQRIEIMKTFAMSRLYYLASILPLPQGISKKIDQVIGKFI